MDKSIIEAVMGEAAKSNMDKRKVGCVITTIGGAIIAKGYNTEDNHAEINAILAIQEPSPSLDLVAYVSHPPCPECAEALAKANIKKVEVVTPFMKFDGDKLRYDLVPPKALEELAKVLTYGARKYKPNNWRECTDLGRYEAALFRHLQAWRMGEEVDEESGLPHLSHALANIVFLLEMS